MKGVRRFSGGSSGVSAIKGFGLQGETPRDEALRAAYLLLGAKLTNTGGICEEIRSTIVPAQVSDLWRMKHKGERVIGEETLARY
jgi:hypothetical protein